MEGVRCEGRSVAEELLAQEQSSLELERLLAAARDEGAKLKREAFSEEAPAVETVRIMEEAPSMAELFALTERPGGTTRAVCGACDGDPYALRTQLLPCSRCSRIFHTRCVGLRSIPFKGATKSDVRNRDLFVKRYFGTWRCPRCKKDSDDDDNTSHKGKVATSDNKKHCALCEVDSPRERPQLLDCKHCGLPYHTSCLKLRRLPFSTLPKDREQRRRFIELHFPDFTGPCCRRRENKPQAPPLQAERQKNPPEQNEDAPLLKLTDVLVVLRDRIHQRDAQWAASFETNQNNPTDLDTFLKDIEADLLRPQTTSPPGDS